MTKKKEKEKKVGENNGQLLFRLPPQVVHASRLDQKQITLTFLKVSPTTLSLSKVT